MKKHYIFLFLLLTTYSSFSQSWLWGRSGGSISYVIGHEKAESMSVDADGNVYLMANVGNGMLKSGDVPLVSCGGTDGLITSFSCSGEYRWSKVIGGTSIDKINRIGVDAQDNVYAAGFFERGSEIYFKNETGNELVLPASGQEEIINQQTIYLVKYSQDGALQWMVMPQADNVTFMDSYTRTLSLDVQISPQGHAYWLLWLPGGTYANGAYTVTGEGQSIHVLEYDTEGQFVEGHQLDIQVTVFPQMKFYRNHATGRFYIGGYFLDEGTAIFGGEVFDNNIMFLSAFDSEGGFLWNKLSDGPISRLYDLCIDSENAVYITGVTDANETFAGHTMQNQGIGSFIMKLTADGDFIWASAPSGQPVYAAFGITLNGNEVAITGLENGLTWSDIVLPGVNDRGTDPYFARFDRNTGSVIAIEKVESNFNKDDRGTKIAADAFGNYYLGGGFTNLLYTGPDTLGNGGQNLDFFVAKFGVENCDCAITQPSFNFSEGDASYAFNYNGSDYDSISWDFGDGETSTEEDPYHYFAQVGVQDVCVTTTNSCGSETYCMEVNAVMGKEDTMLSYVKVYPNPVQDELTIASEEQLNYTLYSVLGSKVGQGTTSPDSPVIATNGLPSGIYLLKLTDAAGSEKIVKVIKE